MRLQKLCHRATYILLVRPSDGKLFVQKRSTLKDYKPGYWDPTPGGVVGYGESYELNAQRELEEEMGLSSVPLKWCFTFHYKDSDVDCWGDAWEGEWEGRPEVRMVKAQNALRGRRISIFNLHDPKNEISVASVIRHIARYLRS